MTAFFLESPTLRPMSGNEGPSLRRASTLFAYLSEGPLTDLSTKGDAARPGPS
jgi:hypothetical protein